MILLDTHVWYWWVGADARLPEKHIAHLRATEGDGLVISSISCWEVAWKVQLGKLKLGIAWDSWIATALNMPSLTVEPVTEQIAIEAARLPGDFHRDPADRLIVATARVLEIPIMSLDAEIGKYVHVKQAPG